ncbi:hypothetical protein AAES_124021 [Amazona aestiva]|uniref:Uncharacterized protein n=1 Tax=Amazona aestiva TaxID=12930 RepID=A0A0Q3TAW6_AMAAE|nr:hypothetical protein AAES_124021 [Amazona aestiva]
MESHPDQVSGWGGDGVYTLKEEAVVKLLQHIVSKRGIRYDADMLKQLLLWAKNRNLLPSVSTAFAVNTWDAMGQAMWEDISKGSEEEKHLATLWRLIRETVAEMKGEGVAAASAFAALAPESGSDSTSKLLFENPKIPLPPTSRIVTISPEALHPLVLIVP